MVEIVTLPTSDQPSARIARSLKAEEKATKEDKVIVAISVVFSLSMSIVLLGITYVMALVLLLCYLSRYSMHN